MALWLPLAWGKREKKHFNLTKHVSSKRYIKKSQFFCGNTTIITPIGIVVARTSQSSFVIIFNRILKSHLMLSIWGLFISTNKTRFIDKRPLIIRWMQKKSLDYDLTPLFAIWFGLCFCKLSMNWTEWKESIFLIWSICTQATCDYGMCSAMRLVHGISYLIARQWQCWLNV